MSIAITSSAAGGSSPPVRQGGQVLAAAAMTGGGSGTVPVVDTVQAQQGAVKYQTSSGIQPDRKAIQVALEEVNQAVQKVAPGLEFSVDKQSGSTVVKVVDSQTKELIRQIPGEEVLRIARAIDKMRGHLVQTKA